jgi:ribosomal protein L7/L12
MDNVHIITHRSNTAIWTHMSGGEVVGTHTEHRYNVEVTIYTSGTSKLNLVKCLKDMTGLGLKDSKGIVDNLATSPQKIRVPLTSSEIIDYKKYLSSLDGCTFDMTDQQKIRDVKLMQLGLYEKDQLVDEVVESDIFNIFANKDNFELIKNILKSRYNSIPEEELLKILDKQNESTL